MTLTEPAAPRETATTGGRWLSRNLLVLSGVSLLQDAASELLYPILPIFLTSVLGAPASVVGAVEGIAEGGAALTKLGAGKLGDRFRRRPLIGLGYGLAALGKVLVAVAVGWPVVLAGRVVDRIGKGGFWMSGTVRRAGDGAPLAGQRIQIWAHTTEGREEDERSHGATLTDKNGAFRLEMPQIVPVFGQPHGHLAYDSGDFKTVFLRPVMRSAKQNSLEAHFVLQPA